MSRESIPISLVAHTVFCPRRAWLEINGEKVESFSIEVGHSVHRGVDNASTSRPRQNRSKDIRSQEIGIHGRVDSINLKDDGSVSLVEYKATPLKQQPQVSEQNQIQLALQSLCLEEEGYRVAEASVWFVAHKTRVEIPLQQDLLDAATDYAEQTRAIVESDTAPPPLIDDQRCLRCSHSSVCLADELAPLPTKNTRVHAENPRGQTLHLTQQGSRASIKSGRVIVNMKQQELANLPLERVASVIVHGNIDLSSALLRQLFWRDVPIVWCSSTGRVYGWARSSSSPNGLARSRQFRLQGELGLKIARVLVDAKIRNQATLLRRNGDKEAAGMLRERSRLLDSAGSRPMIFGIEGEAAQIYFGAFKSMLRESALGKYGFEWIGRVGRGANDEINILLNYAYSLLTAECIKALLSCGLDPHLGMLHSSNRNKPALALDLMEEFRAVIADSTVVGLLNRKEFPKNGFSKAGSTLKISSEGRKAITRAFEKRLQTEIIHPVFGYKVTWRRAIEVQARLILGVIDGSQLQYKGMVIR